jgi:hypothetical protein
MFALAAARAVVRFPLLAAEEISDENRLVKFAALPWYPASSFSRRSGERVMIPARRISSVKYTSTSVITPAGPVTFTALIEVISSGVLSAEIMATSTLLMTIATSFVNVLLVNPPRRIDDAMRTKRYGANVGCCVGFRVGSGVGPIEGEAVGPAVGEAEGRAVGDGLGPGLGLGVGRPEG